MITLSTASPLEQKLTITNDSTNARLTIWFFRSFPVAFSTGDDDTCTIVKENTLGLKEVDVLDRLSAPDTVPLAQEDFDEALQKAQKELHR